MSDMPERRIRSAAEAGAGRLGAVLGLILAFMALEVVAGLLTGSLALLADAGHMLSDAAGISLALLAIRLGRRPATAEKSYGYYRVEVFATFVNGMLLLAVSAFIFVEASRRLSESPEIVGLPMLGVALLGIMVTLASMRILHRDAEASLNLRAAYLEVLGDLLGSMAVVVAGVVIVATGWTPIDPLASIVIGALILPRVWSLLREVVDVLLQATPSGVDLDEIRGHILAAPDVAAVHDLHAWTLTSGLNVVSAHVVMAPGADPSRVLDELCECLTDDFDMEHSTIQLESFDRRPSERLTHP